MKDFQNNVGPLHAASVGSPGGGGSRNSFDRFVDKLMEKGSVFRGGKYTCPAHNDSTPSLSVDHEVDKTLVNCHGGCKTTAVCAALGLTMRDLFDSNCAGSGGARPPRSNGGAKPAGNQQAAPKQKRAGTTPPDVWYHYRDKTGAYVHSVVRWNPLLPSYPTKEFRQCVCRVDPAGNPIEDWARVASRTLKGVTRVLYRLPELLSALDEKPNLPIFFVEGEKDVDALWAAGVPATTTAQGATGARKCIESGGFAPLKGYRVIVWPDNDGDAMTGFNYGAQVVKELNHVGAIVGGVIISAGGHKDAADHLGAGLRVTKSDFEFLASDSAGDAPLPAEWADSIKAHQKASGVETTTKEGEASSGRPEVRVNNCSQAELIEVVTENLVASNTPPTLFSRGNQVCEVSTSDGSPQVEKVSVTRMRRIIGERMNTVRTTAKFKSECIVPKDLAELIKEGRDAQFPNLRGVTSTPPLAIEGGLLAVSTEPGYDERTDLYYCPPPGDPDFPEVSERPSDDEVAAAVMVLENFLRGFRFAELTSRTHAFGLLLTPLLRGIIDGRVPLFAIGASKQGSGKSTLAELVWTLNVPRRMTPRQWPGHDTELAKQIATALQSGAPINVFDNVSSNLKSDALSSLLTSDGFATRLLGRNDHELQLTDNSVWIVTGNNFEFDTDLARRIALIELEPWLPDSDDSAERDTDVVGTVRSRRPELLWSLFTMTANWVAKGQPSAERLTRELGSQYHKWGTHVGGILETAGIPDLAPLLSNTEEVAEKNYEAVAAERTLHAFLEIFEGKSFQLSDLRLLLDKPIGGLDPGATRLRLALPGNIVDDYDRRSKASLEKYLNKINRSPFGKSNMYLDTELDDTMVAHYRVVNGNISEQAR